MTYLLGGDEGVDVVKVAASVIVKDILELLVTLLVIDSRNDSVNIELFDQPFRFNRDRSDYGVFCITSRFDSVFKYKYFSN